MFFPYLLYMRCGVLIYQKCQGFHIQKQQKSYPKYQISLRKRYPKYPIKKLSKKLFSEFRIYIECGILEVVPRFTSENSGDLEGSHMQDACQLPNIIRKTSKFSTWHKACISNFHAEHTADSQSRMAYFVHQRYLCQVEDCI